MTAVSTPHESTTGGLTACELLRDIEAFEPLLIGRRDVRIYDVQQDSRRVKAGDLFVARSGGRVDGRSFIEDAIKAGAAAVLAGPESKGWNTVAVPVICVNDARRALAFVAEAVQGYPSQQLPVVGITGTNGKTTTVALVERGLAAAGARAARLGTTGFFFADESQESNLTTPEADEISRLIGHVLRQGGTHFIMEVSSHALDQGRVDALRMEVAAFTNLTQDHLDHHGDMDHYEAAKRRLFIERTPRKAVINVDDPAGARFADAVSVERLWRVGRAPGCDVRPLHVELDARGIRGTLLIDDSEVHLDTRLIGEHNLENLLLALGILGALNVDIQAAVTGFGGDFAVPGRLERCEGPADDIVVLVDYAHTPDALERVLQAVKGLANGRVHCVFGCGGDRDPNKRPKMGYAVGRWADYAVITNDNPRTEQPLSIAAAIEPGLRQAHARYEVQLDRALAIEQAILRAAPGDVVVIAGKGHEPYQIIGSSTRPFDDRVQARQALKSRRGLPKCDESQGG